MKGLHGIPATSGDAVRWRGFRYCASAGRRSCLPHQGCARSPESLPPAPVADCNRHHSFDRRLDVAAGRRQWRTSSCQALINAHHCFDAGNAVLITVVNYCGGAIWHRGSRRGGDVSCKCPIFWSSGEAPFGTLSSKKGCQNVSRAKNHPRRFYAG